MDGLMFRATLLFKAYAAIGQSSISKEREGINS
jgi:hypothetical protein